MAALKPVVFGPCLGLNTISSPEGLSYDGQTKSWEAARLVNLDVVGGHLVTRPGYTLALSGSWRDSWNAKDGRAFAVKDDVLVQVLDGLTVVPLVPLASPGKVVWADLDGLVFWSNSVESGLIQDGAAVAWGGKTYPVASERGRFVDPTAGQALGAGFGRVWIGRDKELCFTAGAGAWQFEESGANGIEFPARVTMIRAVDDGLYVGTEAGVFFLAGTNPAQMAATLVTTDPVTVIGSDVAVRTDEITTQFNPSGACLFATSRGLVAGLSSGIVLQLTKQRVALDAPAQTAAAVWLPSLRRYMAILHP